MFDSNALKQQLAQRLTGKISKMPTTTLGRFSRTALTGMRTGKMLLGNKVVSSIFKNEDGKDLDIESLVRIISSIGELKGLIMKMGQIMSYIDVALPDELSDALAVLQTQSQPMPFGKVKEIIESELSDRAEEILASIETTPLAAASIGQVHSAFINGQKVAVKIQYPKIENTIMSDFAPTTAVAKIMAKFYPHAKIADFINEMRERLLEECDYIHEAKAQKRFKEIFKHHPRIVIPEVYDDFCSKHVLTTEFIEGVHFEEFLETDPSQELRDEIGKSLFEFYIDTLFRHKIYNCDPHPGNYLFMEDNKIAMLDYGCTREFKDDFVKQLSYLTKAVHRDNLEELHQVYIDVGIVDEDQEYDFDIVRDLIRGFFGAMLEDKEQKISLGTMSFKEMTKKKMELNKLALPAEFLFILRIRFGLMSVLEKLEAVANWRKLESDSVNLIG